MLISIITIVRNAEKTLEQTIRSILTQTYPSIEYIIIDGQSTDRTLEIIRSYEGQISIWKSEPDNGISDAFNKGIKLARGDVIAFLSSDDFYPDNKVIERVSIAFKQHPDQNLLYGKAIYQDPVTSAQRLIKGKPFDRKTFERFMTVPHSTLFMKRTLVDQIGYFNTRYQLAMDYDYLFRALQFGNPLFIDTILGVIRLGGISHRHALRSLFEVFKIQRAHGIAFLRSFLTLSVNVSKSVIRTLLERLHFYPILKAYYRLTRQF